MLQRRPVIALCNFDGMETFDQTNHTHKSTVIQDWQREQKLKYNIFKCEWVTLENQVC